MSSGLMSLLSEDDRRTVSERLRAFADGWRPGLLAEEVRSLPPPGTPARLPLLAGLVVADLRGHWAGAEPVVVEDYLQLHPELAASERALLEVLTAEWAARRAAGQAVGSDAFVKRFPHLSGLIRQRMEVTQGDGSEANTVSPSSGVAVPQSASRQAQGLPEQFGRYRILKKLGRGGMGAVYLAHDRQLERQVALKVPLLDSDNPAVLERFYREARLAATLHHPNLCSIHDVGEIEGVHFLTMPYIEGDALSSWVRASGSVPERVAVTLVRQAALAVHEAHQRGIVHRDLKPANIMIDRRGEPVIMDFGLARRSGGAEEVRLTQSNAILGTPVYMSPEQASGERGVVGPPSDVYSLGVILYELLTGRVPFDGALTDVLIKIVTEPPPPPSRFRPGIDRRLEAVCLRAMAKEPRDRYAGMAEFAAELGAWLHGPAQLAAVVEVEPPPQAAPRRSEREENTELDRPRPRRARPPEGDGGVRKLLLGCLVVAVLLCACLGLTAFIALPRFLSWWEEVDSFPPNGEWHDIDRDWRTPGPDARGETLLPPTFSTGVGWAWSRTALDTRASLPEYELTRSGHHASYSGFSERVEVYVWKIAPQEKQAIFEAVVTQAKKGGHTMQWGKKDGSAVTVRANGRRTTVWYRDEYLYLATGTDLVDTEDILIGVARAVGADQHNEPVPSFP